MSFAKVSFRVRYGAPQVRSLRKVRVDLYRRTPLVETYLYTRAPCSPFLEVHNHVIQSTPNLFQDCIYLRFKYRSVQCSVFYEQLLGKNAWTRAMHTYRFPLFYVSFPRRGLSSHFIFQVRAMDNVASNAAASRSYQFPQSQITHWKKSRPAAEAMAPP